MQDIFRNRLIQLRKQDKKTQGDLAAMLNVDRTTYGGYERGTIVPPYDKIEKIAKYFNVSVDYLMGNTNNKNRDDSNSTSHHIDKTLKNLLHDLKDKSIPLTFENLLLDDASRDLLIASIENSLKMANIISDRKKKG
ncbi:helix-turn-helix transcriptional regulator [Listeria monocytogenes]